MPRPAAKPCTRKRASRPEPTLADLVLDALPRVKSARCRQWLADLVEGDKLERAELGLSDETCGTNEH